MSSQPVIKYSSDILLGVQGGWTAQHCMKEIYEHFSIAFIRKSIILNLEGGNILYIVFKIQMSFLVVLNTFLLLKHWQTEKKYFRIQSKSFDAGRLSLGSLNKTTSPSWKLSLTSMVVVFGWTPDAHQAHLSLPSLAGLGREKIREKKFICQDKGSLLKQKLHMKAGENKRFILYFPSAGDVQTHLGKPVFSVCSGWPGRQTLQ